MCNFCKVKSCYRLFMHQLQTKNKITIRKRNVSSAVKGASPMEYCMGSVKKYDFENYLSTLLLPNPARSSMFAVRAFNIEIAQIQDIVSDHKRGEMRMLFWTETLNLIYKENPPQTPVAVALAKVVKRHGLSKPWLSRIIEARLNNIKKQTPFGRMEELEDYAENTVSSLHYLTLQCLGITDVDVDHAASHVGKAQGIVTMLRSVPYNAQRGSCNIPVQSMIEYKVSQEDIIRGRDDQKVKDLAYSIASVAHRHLETARSFKTKVPKPAVRAFLSTAATDHYLKVLQQADFNMFDGRLQQRNHMLPMRLWLNKVRNRY